MFEKKNIANSKFIIGFRGDNRNPDDILYNGLKPRSNELDILYDGGIDEHTAVCFSKRLSAAALFPIPRNEVGKGNTVIYVVCVEVDVREDKIFHSKLRGEPKNHSRFFANTHGRQVLDMLDLKTIAKWRETLAKGLYGEELAVKAIPPSHIICAIPCIRKRRASLHGDINESYTLDEKVIWQSPEKLSPNLPPSILNSIRVFISQEFAAQAELRVQGKAFQFPVPASGYRRDEAKLSILGSASAYAAKYPGCRESSGVSMMPQSSHSPLFPLPLPVSQLEDKAFVEAVSQFFNLIEAIGQEEGEDKSKIIQRIVALSAENFFQVIKGPFTLSLIAESIQPDLINQLMRRILDDEALFEFMILGEENALEQDKETVLKQMMMLFPKYAIKFQEKYEALAVAKSLGPR